MSDGYFIGQGDKTTCGGTVLDGDGRVNIFGLFHACEGDRVSCGYDGKIYRIRGGISYMESHGRLMAGTLDSFSECPCSARLIPSVLTARYGNEKSTLQALRRADQPASPTVTSHSQGSAQKSSLGIPATLHFTKSFAQSFAITDSQTGQPLISRSYIALVDGHRKVGVTDANGIAIVEALTADSVIELHVIFQSPARELNELQEAMV